MHGVAFHRRRPEALQSVLQKPKLSLGELEEAGDVAAQVEHEPDHQILLCGRALGNQQRQRHHRVVGETRRAARVRERANLKDRQSSFMADHYGVINPAPAAPSGNAPTR